MVCRIGRQSCGSSCNGGYASSCGNGRFSGCFGRGCSGSGCSGCSNCSSCTPGNSGYGSAAPFSCSAYSNPSNCYAGSNQVCNTASSVGASRTTSPSGRYNQTPQFQSWLNNNRTEMLYTAEDGKNYTYNTQTGQSRDVTRVNPDGTVQTGNRLWQCDSSGSWTEQNKATGKFGPWSWNSEDKKGTQQNPLAQPSKKSNDPSPSPKGNSAAPGGPEILKQPREAIEPKKDQLIKKDATSQNGIMPAIRMRDPEKLNVQPREATPDTNSSPPGRGLMPNNRMRADSGSPPSDQQVVNNDSNQSGDTSDKQVAQNDPPPEKNKDDNKETA